MTESFDKEVMKLHGALLILQHMVDECDESRSGGWTRNEIAVLFNSLFDVYGMKKDLSDSLAKLDLIGKDGTSDD